MRRLFLLLTILALPLAAAYTYHVTANFTTGIPGTHWTSNGSLTGGSSNGLVSTVSNGGSVIYDGAGNPNPTPSLADQYKMKATLRITASGGTFVLYTRASANALTSLTPQGSGYAMEMTPTLSGGGCTMAVMHYRFTGGVATAIASHSLACANGMTIRLAQRNGYYMGLTSLNELYFVGDGTFPTGNAGFGAKSLPSGNGILQGEIGPTDQTAPSTFNPANIRSSVFDNRVDLAWSGVADDANGSGVAFYQIHRNGAFYANVRTENWSDTAVSPGGSPYYYSIYAVDMHHNMSGAGVSVPIPAAGSKDPRKTGVRPLGTYWGASPENIDLQSGNLSFSLPLVTAAGRGGTSVPFRLSGNSQNWRQDPGGIWKLGTDVGFGWAWKMLAGSLTPVYADWWTVHHYVYTDSTGAEYDLDVNSGGIWRSKTGIYVEYDAVAKRLYFPSGMYWEFDCLALGTEGDAGTLYPTRLVDTNGNEIKLRYQGSVHYGGVNGSARVVAVEDVRAIDTGGGDYRTYSFNYTGAVPHLTSINTHIGDGANFAFGYSDAHALQDPFTSASYGTAFRLNTVTIPGGLQFGLTYSNSLALTKATMPFGGTLEWLYAAKTLSGSRKHMEVNYRILNANDLQGNKNYSIYHDDPGDENRFAHYYTVVVDASLAADKLYYFNTAADYKLGLLWYQFDRSASGGSPVANLRSSQVTWALTPNGNPYIGATEEIINPGVSGVEKASRVEQEMNDHGNLTAMRHYSYYTPGAPPPLYRSFAYQYKSTLDYTGRHIWNRLESAKVKKEPSGSWITLAEHTYDIYGLGGPIGVTSPRQHDASYNTSFTYRGNVTSSTKFGVTATMTYDELGAMRTSSDGLGHSAAQTPDSSRNYAVPSAISVGSRSMAFTWNGYNAVTASTGPNAAASSFSYDAYARPSGRIAPNGSVVALTYSTSAPHWTLATTGTSWTKTWVDGFGRTIQVDSGYNPVSGPPVLVATVQTKNAPCACTPMGKLWKTSLPYAPGGTVYWTEYIYDALGRTVQVIQPPATLSGPSSGTTNYSYSGVVVTVTDPASKWKKYENDAQGNLIKVTEPRPGGGGATDATDYTYSVLGQLLTSSMTRLGMGSGNTATVTQTRTWVYDAYQRLQSVTHPESSTATNPSIRYEYSGGKLLWKKDAKDQRVEYTYDGEARVTAARRYDAGGTEVGCARVDYYHDVQPPGAPFDASFTANASGRLAATATGCTGSGAGQLIEMYSYTAAGAVTKKRLRIVRTAGTVDKDVTYTYGSDGKVSTVLYPGATVPYTYTYDLMGRPAKMTGPSMMQSWVTIDHAKDVEYGVAGQVMKMKYLVGEQEDQTTGGQTFYVPSYLQEAKEYNLLYQMTRQTIAGAVDIEYAYPAANNGRIVSRTNHLRNTPSGETVTYQYDELNRVTSAASTVGWTQSFAHDGFGNLWSQTMTGGSATPMSVNINMLTNRINSSGWSYDANGNTTSMPALGGGTSGQGFDIDNRMVSWAGAPGTEWYGYLADNKRVWKKAPSGAETYYFYGAGGQKLATYSYQSSPMLLIQQSVNVYFGGKLIRADGAVVAHDRLGSVVWRDGVKHDYLPYGEEMGTATSGNVDKFGTYSRDQISGLDYADQRYFSSALGGRFLSADPYEASGGASAPGSWNRYPYVGGDPVNYADPRGLAEDGVAIDHPYTVLLKQIYARILGAPASPGMGEDVDLRTPLQKSLAGTTHNYRVQTTQALQQLKPECQNKLAAVTFDQETVSGTPGMDFFHSLITMSEFTNYATEYDSEQAGAMVSQIIGSTIPNDTTLAGYIAAAPPANAMVMGDSMIVLTNNFYSASRTNIDRQATLIHELMHLTFRSFTSSLGLQITGHRGLARALGLGTLLFGTGFELEESYASGKISDWVAGCLKK